MKKWTKGTASAVLLATSILLPISAGAMNIKVKKGDTLSNLAKIYHTTVAEIEKANGLKNATIKMGQTLIIPDNKVSSLMTIKTTNYKVAKGDTLTKIAKKYNVTVAELEKENNLTNNTIKVGQVLIVQTETAVTIPVSTPSTTPGTSVTKPETAPISTIKTYTLELSRWGVYNDGTHAIETTKGINDALVWASNNGYTVFQIPAGTYLIDKNSQINMVSNMTLSSDKNVIYQKETNGLTGYTTLNVGPLVHDSVIKGGTFEGDKASHDYYDGAVVWQPNTVYKVGDKVKRPNIDADGWGYYYVAVQGGTSGTTEPAWTWTQNSSDGGVVWKPVERETHEGGEGIVTSGAVNITIDGVKSENFTGDGMAVGGGSLYFKDLYQGNFESGSLNADGEKIASSTEIRTKQPISLSDPSFAKTHTLVIDNPKSLNWHFDIYFYQKDGTFLSEMSNVNRGDIINLPDNAVSFNLVYHQSSFQNAYVEVWNKVQSKNVVVENSELDHNRRQGITVGGGDHITIQNNNIHDIGGVAPMSGIDVEGGYGSDGYVNSNIDIKDNAFSKNARYDVILYDGHDATVEGNKLNSTIGLAVSDPFTNATIKDNTFTNSSIYAYHDVHFVGNEMSGSYTHFEGPNLSVDGMVFKNGAEFNTSSSQPFGITVSNVTLYDSTFASWVEPISAKNITMYGGNLSGDVKPGSTFDNFKMYQNEGTDLPSGIYTNSYFEAANDNRSNGPHTVIPGTLVFDHTTFKGMGLGIFNKDSEVTVKNSTFDVDGDTNAAITIQTAKTVDLENNVITATMKHNDLFRPSVVMLGSYWQKNDPYIIQSAIIKNNNITTTEGVNGISTVFSGVNAPNYDIEDNNLYNAKLDLKAADTNKNNNLYIQNGTGFVKENPIHLSFAAQSVGTAVNSVAFNGNQYVAVGSNGSLATSTDGQTWTTVDSPNKTSLFTSVIWNKDLFVAVGNQGVIMTSPDGINWTLRNTHSIYASFQNVKFLNNQYIAVAYGGIIETSPDGITWTLRNLPNNSVNPLTDVTWNGHVFVAISIFGNVYESTDGVTWKQSQTPGELVSITTDGNQFVAVGLYGMILTSPDGINWTRQISSTQSSLRSIAYNGAHFVAVGDNGVVLSSSTGIDWSTEHANTSANLTHVEFVNGKFIISSGASSVLVGNASN